MIPACGKIPMTAGSLVCAAVIFRMRRKFHFSGLTVIEEEMS